MDFKQYVLSRKKDDHVEDQFLSVFREDVAKGMPQGLTTWGDAVNWAEMYFGPGPEPARKDRDFDEFTRKLGRFCIGYLFTEYQAQETRH